MRHFLSFSFEKSQSDSRKIEISKWTKLLVGQKWPKFFEGTKILSD